MKDVRAYKVSFAGYEDFKFAVHRCNEDHHSWTVSELSSGSAVAQSLRTKKLAIEGAKKMLDTTNPEGLKQKINKSIKNYDQYKKRSN